MTTRALLAPMLAFAVAFAPAAQASACRCGADTSEAVAEARAARPVRACCCGGAGRCCCGDACAGAHDSGEAPSPVRASGACPCARPMPLHGSASSVERPVPAAGVGLAAFAPAVASPREATVAHPAPIPRAPPHPGVALPLLL